MQSLMAGFVQFSSTFAELSGLQRRLVASICRHLILRFSLWHFFIYQDSKSYVLRQCVRALVNSVPVDKNLVLFQLR